MGLLCWASLIYPRGNFLGKLEKILVLNSALLPETCNSQPYFSPVSMLWLGRTAKYGPVAHLQSTFLLVRELMDIGSLVIHSL